MNMNWFKVLRNDKDDGGKL